MEIVAKLRYIDGVAIICRVRHVLGPRIGYLRRDATRWSQPERRQQSVVAGGRTRLPIRNCTKAAERAREVNTICRIIGAA